RTAPRGIADEAACPEHPNRRSPVPAGRTLRLGSSLREDLRRFFRRTRCPPAPRESWERERDVSLAGRWLQRIPLHPQPRRRRQLPTWRHDPRRGQSARARFFLRLQVFSLARCRQTGSWRCAAAPATSSLLVSCPNSSTPGAKIERRFRWAGRGGEPSLAHAQSLRANTLRRIFRERYQWESWP